MKRRITTPPTLDEVVEYIKSNRQPGRLGKPFFDHYQRKGWRKNGKSILPIWREEADRWWSEEKKRVAKEGY